MRFAWLWFNRVSTYVGLAFMLAEGCAWIWCSIHASHPLSYRQFHQLYDQAIFQFADWLGSHIG
jgi:hypothetical protein